MVFDDSILANHQEYYSLLEQTKTANDLYYFLSSVYFPINQ